MREDREKERHEKEGREDDEEIADQNTESGAGADEMLPFFAPSRPSSSFLSFIFFSLHLQLQRNVFYP